MATIYKIYDIKNEEYPIPESDNLIQMCNIAHYISKGSERFPSTIVTIKNQYDETVVVFVSGEKFIKG